MRSLVLKITDEQYRKLVIKSKEETLKAGRQVSIAEIIRYLIDKYVDKIVFVKK